MEERRLVEERAKRDRERQEREQERERLEREEREREKQRAIQREEERERGSTPNGEKKELKEQHFQRLVHDRETAAGMHWSASTTGSRSRRSSLAGAAGSQRDRESSSSSLVSTGGREVHWV